MLVMLVAPPFATAQRAERLPRIAIVFNNIPLAEMVGPDPVEPNARAIVHGLRDLGWVEGRNIVIERRSDEGRPERMPILMQELVGLPVDVIVTSGPGAVSAQRATKTIPIVGVHRDPVSSGLAASLARPDRNFTGVSASADTAIVGKLLQLLREVLPIAARIAMIAGTITGDPPWRRETEAAARALGVSLIWVGVDKPEEFQQAFARIARDHAEAVVVTDSAVSWVHRHLIFDFAVRQGLPAIYEGREYCESGGLMSYGTSDDAFQRLAAYVDKILKGAKPADLPIEQTSKYELVINLKTAKAMGLTIPRSVLARADEVIR
jgi:putative ABC transport system substrate-binding protein